MRKSKSLISSGKKQTVSNNDVSILSEHVCEQGLAVIIFQNTRKTLTIILAKKIVIVNLYILYKSLRIDDVYKLCTNFYILIFRMVNNMS